MGLHKYEMYHGAALLQMVRKPEFSLKIVETNNREDGWGTYKVYSDSKDYVLFVKSTSYIHTGPYAAYYSQFTFSMDDIQRMRKFTEKNRNVLVCLVCDHEHICLLNADEVKELQILKDTQQCNVKVSWRKGTELDVKSRYGGLNHKVPRSRLKMFEW